MYIVVSQILHFACVSVQDDMASFCHPDYLLVILSASEESG